MVVLAGTCDRDALFNNYMIAERVSALGFLLLSALYISSISSCLATLYGTPRVLQSIASENVIPGLGRLSEGVKILRPRLLYTLNFLKSLNKLYPFSHMNLILTERAK